MEKHLDPVAHRQAAGKLDIPHYFLDDAGGAGTIIGALARVEAVVSMRLHALIFAASQGVPLVGVVYDPKVSSFLKYMGQELFVDLGSVTAQNLCAMIDRAVCQSGTPQSREEAVARLQETEQRSVTVARELRGG